MTYYQTLNWTEQYWGEISVLLTCSDSYSGLFEQKQNCIETNIIEFETVTKKANSKVGGMVTNEMQFTINEAQCHSIVELAALNFIKAARVPTNKRFIALFINTNFSNNTDIPDINNNLFYGIIQPNFDSDEKRWFGLPFGTSNNPISEWKIKAKPYDEVTIKNISVSDLINGNTTESITGIDAEWEIDNVESKPGFFDYDSKYVYVDKLVSLGKLLQKLGDNLTTSINNLGLGNINIIVDRSELDGKWFPTYWYHNEYSATARFVGKVKSSIAPLAYSFFTFYQGTEQRLVIDPNAAEDEDIWISYRLIKPQDAEPTESSAKNYRFDQIDDYITLIEEIAISFGCFAKIYWESDTNLHIKFIDRQNFKQNEIYIRTATSASKKISAEVLSEDSKYYAHANYLAYEGQAIYRTTDDTGGQYFADDRINSDNKGKRLLLSISPTIVNQEWGEDDDYITPFHVYVEWRWDGSIHVHNGIIWFDKENTYKLFPLAHFPHGHYMVNHLDGEGKPIPETMYSRRPYGLHTAIYIKCNKYAIHPHSDKEPDSYWTPVGLLGVKYNDPIYGNIHKYFDKLSDYINFLNNIDKEYFSLEYNLESPFFYGFSENSDGSNPSWKCLDIGASFTLDGVMYLVTEIEWNFVEKSIKYVLQGLARFDFDFNITETPTLILENNNVIGGNVYNGIKNILPSTNNYLPANETIVAGQVVSLTNDGKIEVAHPSEDHFGKIYGIALTSASIDQYSNIQISGIYNIPNSYPDLTCGNTIYLREPIASPINISHSFLQGRTELEELYCEIGQAVTNRTIKLFDDFPNQAIFDYEIIET